MTGINLKEIRIGNYYLYDGEVSRFTFEDIQNLEFEDGYIGDPLPLSPKLLERAGFVRRKDDDWIETSIDCGYLYIGSNMGGNSVTLFQNNRISTGVHCKYLHQLQNLYFALTGKELELKP